jgi:hypothetical protein
MKRAAPFIALLAAPLLQACGSNRAELPPLPTTGPDMCIEYRSYRYSREAAAHEAKAALDAHNGNEAVFYDKCIAGRQGTGPGVSR